MSLYHLYPDIIVSFICIIYIESTYKWLHDIVLFYLTYFTQYDSL